MSQEDLGKLYWTDYGLVYEPMALICDIDCLHFPSGWLVTISV